MTLILPTDEGEHMNNRIYNARNPYQGNFKRVLCVCSAGLLRSPTAAVVLSQPPFNFNTRAAGAEPSFALVPVDEALLAWADEIVCMTLSHESALRALIQKIDPDYATPIYCLNIPDDFAYRDPDLMKMIAERYTATTKYAA